MAFIYQLVKCLAPSCLPIQATPDLYKSAEEAWCALTHYMMQNYPNYRTLQPPVGKESWWKGYDGLVGQEIIGKVWTERLALTQSLEGCSKNGNNHKAQAGLVASAQKRLITMKNWPMRRKIYGAGFGNNIETKIERLIRKLEN